MTNESLAIIERDWNGMVIRQKGEYLCASDMCLAAKKRLTYLASFLRTQRPQRVMNFDKKGDFIVKELDGIWYKMPLAMVLASSLHGGLSLRVHDWLIWEPLKGAGKLEEFTEELIAFSMHPAQGNNILVSEFDYRNHLRSLWGGEKEVAIEGGRYRIDLLTEDSLIEVKIISSWLKGIEQLNIYSAYYPAKKKKLVLFGSSRKQDLSFIHKSGSQFQIDVYWMPPDGSIQDLSRG
jgi:hypothetical protein